MIQNNQSGITALEFPENVRKRKEMYINDPSHCIFEIVDNSIDEFAAGRCREIAICINKNTATIEDDGGGIPIEKSSNPLYSHLSQCELAFTKLHAGGKFGDKSGYQTYTGGLHGVGASCVNALSSSMVLTVGNALGHHKIEFSKGKTIKPLEKIDDIQSKGTNVTFTLDEEIWEDETFDLKAIKKRVQQLAYLNPGLTLYLILEDTGENLTFSYENGISEYVESLTENKEKISEIMYTSSDEDNILIDLSFTYTTSYSQDIYSFCNNISTDSGGDHLIGFRAGIAKALERYMLDNKIIKESSDIESDDCREGIIGIVSVKVKEPKFEGQGKSRIKMPAVRTAVRIKTEEFFLDYLEKFPKEAERITNKVLIAAKARKAAKKARDLTRRDDKIFSTSGLPGKLAACQTKNPEEAEIFLVEGDSAAGSAKAGRDRKTQAILPVFGKILNTEKETIDKVISNIKILEIVKALGCGIGESFDISKLKYHKIIIFTDADKTLSA